MDKEQTKVMIFGVFDGLHEGHLFFLKEAQKKAKRLIIVVTPDELVGFSKGRLPRHPLHDRIESIREAMPESKVIEGDTTMGVWTPIVLEKPDIIICGYDQQALYGALAEIADTFHFKLDQITESHREDELHSSLLRTKE